MVLEAANTHRELISVHDLSFTRVLPHLRPCSVEVVWVVRDIQKDAEKCQADVHSAYRCHTGSRIRWHPPQRVPGSIRQVSLIPGSRLYAV